MPLWGNEDTANNAPKYQVLPLNTANGETMFNNTSVDAFVTGEVDGVFAVDVTEAGLNTGVAHPGWVVVKQGTGPVNGFAIANGGTGYANADVLTVSGGTINAVANLTTNSTGGIINVTFSNFGSGFTNTASLTRAITTSAGTNANVTVTLGGRAGRVSMETLVAMTSITGDSENTVFNNA